MLAHTGSCAAASLRSRKNVIAVQGNITFVRAELIAHCFKENHQTKESSKDTIVEQYY